MRRNKPLSCQEQAIKGIGQGVAGRSEALVSGFEDEDDVDDDDDDDGDLGLIK